MEVIFYFDYSFEDKQLPSYLYENVRDVNNSE